MPTPNPRSAASIRSIPLHALLVPIPLVCFVATLVTDLVYWSSTAMLWADMSAWFLAIGLIVAVFAVLAGLVDVLKEPRIRRLREAWIHIIGNAVALALAIVNAFVHSRDAYTSVVPTGLVLSFLVVAILAVTGWNGWSMVHRHAVGVGSEVRS